ncbi:uncharacterized protein LOC135078970 isoform X1 [Ostrinia nubilalis]|uniref:uncharacterized protein LOC135078970 isoform X1 n=1 Tax=Ostrinia nubilalis TaxID=29057 RepID=UPI0030823EF5
MSAPSDSATSPSPCACTNISLMQLFHELKQKFPGVPDHVVSNTIELYCHDKQACETHLHSEVKASLTHAYHASSSAAARQLNELKLNPPSKCRNQPIVKHEIAKSTPIQSITCQGPQTAIISSNDSDDGDKKVNTDANQNVVETVEETPRSNNNTSPITINLDNCFAKYSVESPSDLELTNENVKEEKPTADSAPLDKNLEQPESTNYRILKSNKIKSNLHERLEKGKEKKTIKKEEPEDKKDPEPKPEHQEKPKRPNTLDFIKPNPDIAFKQTLKEPEPDVSHTVSPVPSLKHESQSAKPSPLYRQERVYPLNLSVNVNCHMDLSRAYDDPWLEDYDSPRAITSVNLTVCTPTSSMASPVRDSRGGEDEGGFEGHVTVTVSPSTARPPRRRAPPPPSQPSRIETPRPARSAPEPPGSTPDRSLIERQKQRLDCLVKALSQEKGHLAQLKRETQILAAPLPPPSATQKLREYVELLRDQCDTMAKRLEMTGNVRERERERDDSGNFYSNIYTGQQPSASWQCHLCTFRNHPLLNKCEQCEMPRIVGTSPPRTQDSGFGSFRDSSRSIRSNKQLTNTDTDLEDFLSALPKLNC